MALSELFGKEVIVELAFSDPPKNMLIYNTCLCNSRRSNELSRCHGELVSGIVEPFSKEPVLMYSWFQRVT